MYEGPPRHGAETEYRRRQSPIIRRPDRIALWAVGMAVVGMVAAAASAHAGSGGTGATGGKGSCTDTKFGSRSLSVGDCGTDVQTLHWIMKADSYRVGLDKEFDDPTESEVQDFQRAHDLRRSGV